MVSIPPTPVKPPSVQSVSNVVHHTISFGSINGVLILGAVAFIVVFLIIIWYYTKKSSKPVCDLYALNIDDDKGEMSWLCLEKVYDNFYIAYGDEPALVIVPQSTKVYTFKGTKTGRKYILTYVVSSIGMPLDANNLVAYHLLTSLKDYMEIDSSDVRSCIAELYRLGKKVHGKLVISPDIKLSLSFNVRELTKSILKRYLQGAHSSILHMFNMFKKVDVMTSIINALARYRESRYGWLKALITLITIIGFIAIIGYAVISSLGH